MALTNKDLLCLQVLRQKGPLTLERLADAVRELLPCASCGGTGEGTSSMHRYDGERMVLITGCGACWGRGVVSFYYSNAYQSCEKLRRAGKVSRKPTLDAFGDPTSPLVYFAVDDVVFDALERAFMAPSYEEGDMAVQQELRRCDRCDSQVPWRRTQAGVKCAYCSTVLDANDRVEKAEETVVPMRPTCRSCGERQAHWTQGRYAKLCQECAEPMRAQYSKAQREASAERLHLRAKADRKVLTERKVLEAVDLAQAEATVEATVELSPTADMVRLAEELAIVARRLQGAQNEYEVAREAAQAANQRQDDAASEYNEALTEYREALARVKDLNA